MGLSLSSEGEGVTTGSRHTDEQAEKQADKQMSFEIQCMVAEVSYGDHDTPRSQSEC